MIKFRDLRVVDPMPGQPDIINHMAMRRKRYGLEGGPASEEVTDEALNMAQRMARARALRRNKSKIKLGRARAARRMASMETLKKRARKAARTAIFMKLSKGIAKSELPFARRQEIEKRIDKMGSRVDRIAKKLLPKIRKKELERHKAKNAQ